MLHTAKLSVTVFVDTEGNPNEAINELLDVLGEVPTAHFGVSWDDCNWDWTENGACYNCGDTGELTVVKFDAGDELWCDDCLKSGMGDN